MRLLVLQTIPARVLSFNIEGGVIEDEGQTIIELENTPDGIQVDAAAGHIYWTNMGKAGSDGYYEADGTIERCDLDGTNRVKLLGDGAIMTPKELQLVGDWLYFCDREGMAVRRVRKDGSQLETITERGLPVKEEMMDRRRHCVGVQVIGETLYWTQKGAPKAGQGRIYRAAVPELGAKIQAEVEVASDLPEPIDLYSDGNLLYWTDRGAAPEGNSLNVGELDAAGDIKSHRVIANGFDEAIGCALLDSASAFVTDLGGHIWLVDLASGSKDKMYTGGPMTGLCLSPV